MSGYAMIIYMPHGRLNIVATFTYLSRPTAANEVAWFTHGNMYKHIPHRHCFIKIHVCGYECLARVVPMLRNECFLIASNDQALICITSRIVFERCVDGLSQILIMTN